MTYERRRIPRRTFAALVAVLGLFLAGCGSQKPDPIYENAQQGFRFCPPAGWSKRVPLEKPAARPVSEQLVVQYKRLQAANPAWLRVTVVDAPRSVPLQSWLSRRPAGPGWRREGEVERLEVNGLAAARAAYRGRMGKHNLVGEVTAVAAHGRVYVFSGFFPPGDEAAREQVRRAVGSAAWPDATERSSRGTLFAASRPSSPERAAQRRRRWPPRSVPVGELASTSGAPPLTSGPALGLSLLEARQSFSTGFHHAAYCTGSRCRRRQPEGGALRG